MVCTATSNANRMEIRWLIDFHFPLVVVAGKCPANCSRTRVNHIHLTSFQMVQRTRSRRAPVNRLSKWRHQRLTRYCSDSDRKYWDMCSTIRSSSEFRTQLIGAPANEEWRHLRKKVKSVRIEWNCNSHACTKQIPYLERILPIFTTKWEWEWRIQNIEHIVSAPRCFVVFVAVIRPSLYYHWVFHVQSCMHCFC